MSDESKTEAVLEALAVGHRTMALEDIVVIGLDEEVYVIPVLNQERADKIQALLAQDPACEEVIAQIPFYNVEARKIDFAAREVMREQPNLVGQLLTKFIPQNVVHVHNHTGPDAPGAPDKAGFWLDLRHFRSLRHEVDVPRDVERGASDDWDVDETPYYVHLDTGVEVPDNLYVTTWNQRDAGIPTPGDYATYFVAADEYRALEGLKLPLKAKRIFHMLFVEARSATAAFSYEESDSIGLKGLHCYVANLTSLRNP